MKIWTVLLLFIVSIQARAQKADVLILDEDIDSQDLKKEFNVHRESTYKSSLPDRKLRDQALRGVAEVIKWDSLKKDILYMDLKTKDSIYLHKKYPEFSAERLKKLQEQIH
jgi:hypothetical protein